jgi:hypothetical protein
VVTALPILPALQEQPDAAKQLLGVEGPEHEVAAAMAQERQGVGRGSARRDRQDLGAGAGVQPQREGQPVHLVALQVDDHEREAGRPPAQLQRRFAGVSHQRPEARLAEDLAGGRAVAAVR